VDKLTKSLEWCKANPFKAGTAVGSWVTLFGGMFLYLVFK
jgi:hypothetical protein